MKRKLSGSESKRMLSKVPANVSFWLCTNEQLRNLDELASALNRVTDEVFRYHVNRDKNDFEAWIRDVINDKELARDISRIKTRSTLVRKIHERVDSLRKLVKNVPWVKKSKAKKSKQKKSKPSSKSSKKKKKR